MGIAWFQCQIITTVNKEPVSKFIKKDKLDEIIVRTRKGGAENS